MVIALPMAGSYFSWKETGEMFRNTLAIIIAVAVLTVGLTLQSAQAQSQSQSALAARATVSDLGIRSKVEVKITDGTKVKGRIGEIKD